MKTAHLGDLCEIIIGRTPARREQKFWGKGTPWLSISDMTGQPYIHKTKEQITSLADNPRLLVHPGTVLFSFKLSIGKVAIAGIPLYTNEAIAALPIKDSDQLDEKYLQHALRSLDLKASANRAAMGLTLNKATLSNIEIPVPNIDEQQRIATILDKADAIRAKRRKVIDHLENFTESIFKQMFHDVSDDVPLTELVDIKSGSTPRKSNTEFWDGDVPWFSPKDIKKSDLYDSIDHVTQKALEDTNLRLLPANTPVVVVRGMILAHSAPVAVLRTPATINQDLKALVPKQGADVDFLTAAVRVKKRWLLDRVATSAHGTKRLETRVLQELPVPVVSDQEQGAFSDAIQIIRQLQERTESKLVHDDHLFSSLQARAFSGEL